MAVDLLGVEALLLIDHRQQTVGTRWPATQVRLLHWHRGKHARVALRYDGQEALDALRFRTTSLAMVIGLEMCRSRPLKTG
jgi:hypothetical protein